MCLYMCIIYIYIYICTYTERDRCSLCVYIYIDRPFLRTAMFGRPNKGRVQGQRNGDCSSAASLWTQSPPGLGLAVD